MKRRQTTRASSSASKEFKESDSVLRKKFKRSPCNYTASPSFLKEPNQNDQNLSIDYPLNISSSDPVKVNESVPKECNIYSDNVNLNSLSCESVHKESSKKAQNISSKIDQESSKDNVFSPNDTCSSTFVHEHSNNHHKKELNPLSNLSKSFQNDAVLFNHEGTVLKIFPCIVVLSKNNVCFDNNLFPSFLKEPNQNDQNLSIDYPLNISSKNPVKVNESLPKESNSYSDNVNLNSLGCESVHKESSNKAQNISSKIDQESSKDTAFSPNDPCSSTFVQEHSNNQHNKELNPVSNLLSKSFQNDVILVKHEGTVLKIFPCNVDLSKNNVCFNNFLQKPDNELPKEKFQSLPKKISTFDSRCIYRATSELVKHSTRKPPRRSTRKPPRRSTREPPRRSPRNLTKEVSIKKPVEPCSIYDAVRNIYIKAKLNKKKCDWEKMYNKYFNSYFPLIKYDAFLELVRRTISRHNMCVKMDSLRSRLKKITDKKEAEFRRKNKIYYDKFRCVFTEDTCQQDVKVCKVKLFDNLKQHLFNEKDPFADTSCHNKPKTAEVIKVSLPAMDMGI